MDYGLFRYCLKLQAITNVQSTHIYFFFSSYARQRSQILLISRIALVCALFLNFFFYHYYYYYYYEYDFVFFPLCCCYKRKNLFFLGVVDFHNVKCRHESDFGKRNQLNGFICFALINIRNKMKLKQRTSIYVSQIGLVEPNLWIAQNDSQGCSSALLTQTCFQLFFSSCMHRTHIFIYKFFPICAVFLAYTHTNTIEWIDICVIAINILI